MKVVSVRKDGTEIQEGLFRLSKFIPGVCYLDPIKNQLIGSIGKHVFSGEIYAAVDLRFHQDPNYECLYMP